MARIGPAPTPELIARISIEGLAGQLNLGPATSDLQPIQGLDAWVQSFGDVDIYYSPNAGPHEVHGEIKRKYNILGGPRSSLGLPITNEASTRPSPIPPPFGLPSGRFNDFERGSIYWAPWIGPRMIQGSIRDTWQSLGGEIGDLGFPVEDQYRLKTENPSSGNPSTDPVVLWNIFENGGIASAVIGTAACVPAELTSDQMKCLVRAFFDRAIHQSPENLGLYPDISIVDVTTWGYDIFQSPRRAVTFRLAGFRDNGLLQDTTFVLDVGLRFAWQATQALIDPPTKTLVAELVPNSLVVQAYGLGYDSVQSGLQRAITDQFAQPVAVSDVAMLSVGTDNSLSVNVIDMIVTPEGGMQFLLNNTDDGGGFRKLVAQFQITQLLQKNNC